MLDLVIVYKFILIYTFYLIKLINSFLFKSPDGIVKRKRKITQRAIHFKHKLMRAGNVATADGGWWMLYLQRRWRRA